MSTSFLSLVLVLVIATSGVVLFNRLVALRNRHLNAFSQIDVQLQRRHELIPNLVETARAYLEHEHETLSAVTRARNGAASCRQAAAAAPGKGERVRALAAAENALGAAMGRLNVVMEAYPALLAERRLADLHAELATTENRVGYARQAYSDAVMRYNVAREQFPANVLAGLCRFEAAASFEVDSPELRRAVHVSFA